MIFLSNLVIAAAIGGVAFYLKELSEQYTRRNDILDRNNSQAAAPVTNAEKPLTSEASAASA